MFLFREYSFLHAHEQLSIVMLPPSHALGRVAQVGRRMPSIERLMNKLQVV